jgi:hypothetical protein
MHLSLDFGVSSVRLFLLTLRSKFEMVLRDDFRIFSDMVEFSPFIHPNAQDFHRAAAVLQIAHPQRHRLAPGRPCKFVGNPKG